MKVEESLNVTFDETPPPPKTSPLEDDDLVEEEAIEVWKSIRYAHPRIWKWRIGDFLVVGTTLDIFQNIIFIPYFQYGVLVFSGYGVLSFIPLWSLVSAGTDTPYLP
ncbi:hypothetical protein Tco_0522084 [Tanacetum coccineum]